MIKKTCLLFGLLLLLTSCSTIDNVSKEISFQSSSTKLDFDLSDYVKVSIYKVNLEEDNTFSEPTKYIELYLDKGTYFKVDDSRDDYLLVGIDEIVMGLPSGIIPYVYQYPILSLDVNDKFTSRYIYEDITIYLYYLYNDYKGDVEC